MTNEQVTLIIRGGPIHAVLLTRGGWVSDGAVTVTATPIVDIWQISLWSPEGEHINDVFVDAKDIVGISINRRRPHEPERPGGGEEG